MKTDPCAIATDYAVQMSQCTTIEALEAFGRAIKANSGAVTDWLPWLRIEYISKRDSFKEVDIADALNTQGKKYAKEQGLL